MCLLLSFGCCGSSGSCASPSPAKKQLEVKTRPDQEQDHEQAQDHNQDQYQDIQLQQPAATITSQSDLHLELSSHYLSRSDSLSSLPLSMSLSLRPMALPRTNSSNRSSWGPDEDFCDMDEYERRTDWWLHGATANDHNLKPIQG